MCVFGSGGSVSGSLDLCLWQRIAFEVLAFEMLASATGHRTCVRTLPGGTMSVVDTDVGALKNDEVRGMVPCCAVPRCRVLTCTSTVRRGQGLGGCMCTT